MPFDYEANITAVVNALKGYNTSTADVDLSSGLTTRIKQENISQDDPEIMGIRSDRLPAVYVRLSTADEEASSLGNTGPAKSKKFKTANFEIIGVYRREGIGATHSDLMTECYRLAENIEGVFQAEHNLSGTALWCNPVRTSFTPPVQLDTGAWIKGLMVELEAKYIFR